jgi:hypothetical protein
VRHSAPSLVFLSLTMWICGASARAAGVKTPLIREAVVHGASIYLSDLLPESSPAALRDLTKEIVVGQSPRPGSTRVLSSEAMVKLLKEENLLDRLQAHGSIVIRRASRAITPEEVTEAMRKTLRRNDLFSGAQISPEAVRFPGALMVSTENPDLHVTRLELDRTLHVMEFWIVSGSDPGVLPFLVMVRPTGGTRELAEQLDLPSTDQRGAAADMARSLSGLYGERHTEHGETEVEPGKAARLHLTSASGTQMFLNATALERGAIGQRVRVKIQPTGRVLDARVVGHGQLEAEF